MEAYVQWQPSVVAPGLQLSIAPPCDRRMLTVPHPT